MLGRGLFGLAARAADTHRPPFQRGHVAFDLEGLGVRLAVRGRDAVGPHGYVPRLQPLLQLGLGILAPVVGGGGVDGLAEQARDQGLRRLEAVQAPMLERLRAYEQRIRELENELGEQTKENRELLKLKIEMIRSQMESERSRVNFN